MIGSFLIFNIALQDVDKINDDLKQEIKDVCDMIDPIIEKYPDIDVECDCENDSKINITLSIDI